MIATEIGSKTADELRTAYSDTIVDWPKELETQRDVVTKTIADIFRGGIETGTLKDQTTDKVQTIQVGDINMAYMTLGQGEPLIISWSGLVPPGMFGALSFWKICHPATE